ncbi:MAG: cyclase family protein [Planctomycetes bacterium]|nr:cyclase family protein [Planctomycetota bacterium]
MIYDVSPPLSPRLAVWPGDTPLTREVLLDNNQDSSDASKSVSNITLSTLHATVHLGAHADAPSHYGRGAPTIDQRRLDLYLGPCQVLRVSVGRGGLITPSRVSPPFRAERLLLATGTFPDPHVFNEDFAALSPDFVALLARHGVRLVGIDTPSVDPFTSKDLPAHHAALEHDLAILEGLVLAEVPEGVYELIALPLKLVGFDASPVRAILRKNEDGHG